MKTILRAAIAAVLAAAAASCGGPARGSATVRIAAAADLRYALEALAAGFKTQHPEVTVTTAYGSSGVFYSQIENGAPFDVFLSADVDYPKQLDAAGFTLPGSTFIYAVGRIVVWVRKTSTLDLGRGLQTLLDPSVAHVAIANPQHAPYGQAAQAALTKAGVFAAVEPKLVLGENVSQTLQFVQSGSADAGIVALSLALAPTVVDAGRYWEVPLDLYPRLEQGGTIMKTAASPEAARQFTAFMQGETGRQILQRFGFSMVAG